MHRCTQMYTTFAHGFHCGILQSTAQSEIRTKCICIALRIEQLSPRRDLVQYTTCPKIPQQQLVEYYIERGSNQVHIYSLKNRAIITLKEVYYQPRWCICTRRGLRLERIIGSGLAIGTLGQHGHGGGGPVLQLKDGVYVPEEVQDSRESQAQGQ